MNRGDTSVRGSLDGLRRWAPDCNYGRHRLSPEITLFEYDGLRDREKLGCIWVLQAGINAAGLYVLKAEVPEDTAAIFVQACFVPARAASDGDIVTLFDYDITRSRLEHFRLA